MQLSPAKLAKAARVPPSQRRDMFQHAFAKSGRAAVLFSGSAACAGVAAFASQTPSAADSLPAAFKSDEWRTFKVVDKHDVSHNSFFLRLSFNNEHATAGLPVASCIIVRAPIGHEKEDGSKNYVVRPYTPISRPDSVGHFDLVVKEYPEGNMSKHLAALRVGDELECKGPIVKLPYEANMRKRIGLIAGGTGITPMLQVAEHILRNGDDETDVSMVYANQTPGDILMKDRLDALADKHSNFRVHYVVDKLGSWTGKFTWKGSTGYITPEIVKEHLPEPSEDNLILVCGPPPMMKAISGDKAPDKTQGELTGILADMGYTKDSVFKF